ncbi:transposase, partial [Allocoleopsis sp.]|uniref:RNA-guided endonuclease InsQ/TnpB family protein n=1 Tax=Allocoleopsis sp. TaxID=3088169 RepID=UPI002FD24E2F
MSVVLNYTYRIYPDAQQEAKLLDWLEICRGSYNYALREIKDWCNSRKCPVDKCSLEAEYIIPADTPFPGYYRQQNALPKAKKDYPRLTEVPSQVLQTTIRRLHDAWDFFHKRGFGFPRFKKYGQLKSLLFPQIAPDSLTGWQIKIPKLGSVQIKVHRPIPEGFVIKQVRIVRKAARFEAVISIESDIEIPTVQPHGRAVGIDLGLEKFLTTSDREFIGRPKFFVEKQRKLKLLQRRLARKIERSANYEKARRQVAKHHNNIAAARKDYHYKTANHLCRDQQIGMIFAEDLNLKAMSRGMLCKQTLDAAFGQFLDILKFVCWKKGIFFARVNPDGTSQTCPMCWEATGKKELSHRTHSCQFCGYQTDRDHAAAEVVRQRGLEQLVARDSGESKEPVAVGLPGTGKNQSRSEAK